MKKIFILLAFVATSAICSNIYAQQAAPPGAGDKDLSDRNVKNRSIDLERVDRDARKTATQSTINPASPEDRLAAKYTEIKTDYEQIQISQDAVIKTYQGKGKIDFTKISKSAMEINTSAKRLSLNLFPAPPVEITEKKDAKKDDKTTVVVAKPLKSVRDLIVDLDNAIGSFATSPMFQNLRTVDAAVAEKAKIDLEKIIELSADLNAAVQKTASDAK